MSSPTLSPPPSRRSSRPGSSSDSRTRHSVRFTLGDSPGDEHDDEHSPPPLDGRRSLSGPARMASISPAHSRDSSVDRSVNAHRPRLATIDDDDSQLPTRPRPSLTHNASFSQLDDILTQEVQQQEKSSSQRSAQGRAQRLARRIGAPPTASASSASWSAPASAHSSPTLTYTPADDDVSPRQAPNLPTTSARPHDQHRHLPSGDDIPLLDLSRMPTASDTEADGDSDSHSDADDKTHRGPRGSSHTSEAHKLVRMHTSRKHGLLPSASSRRSGLSAARAASARGGGRNPASSSSAAAAAAPALPLPNGSAASLLRSGQVTPVEERDPEDYVPRPRHYRGGILYSLLKLYDAAGQSVGAHQSPPAAASLARSRQNSAEDLLNVSGSHSRSPETENLSTAPSSGRSTPRPKGQKWYKNKGTSGSTSSLVGLLDSSSVLAAPGLGGVASGQPPSRGGHGTNGSSNRPPARRQSSASRIGAAVMGKPRLEDEIRITVHIAETMARQKYLLKICKALMSFGAPTHRLEEYMKMSARVLEIDGQFLYIPGCMIVSFDDASTHTTEVKIVKVAQGVDLGKLRDTHQVYKEVVHDVIGVEEATQRVDEIISRKKKFHPLILVGVYGLASASVGPFAFEARLIDLPASFLLGAILGCLQLLVAPRSDLFSNVFEIAGAVLTSFLARAFGSIRGGHVFCFSALAQSSIALILPGYTVLCGALELQSKSMVAGSVRMVYAIIYSLFLGFGITIGTALFGLMDSHAISATKCENQMPRYWSFFFVPVFTMSLIVINQGKWKQAPVMILIAFAGYVVNYFSALKFPSNAQISNTLGAFAVGVLGNLYSRLRHGVAAAALLPAIFVQVPSGLAASGSLVSGVRSADQILNNTNSTTPGSSGSGGSMTVGTDNVGSNELNSVVFTVGYSMIQVAIGITVGLFLSALVVYPFGKRRSGLFSF